MIEMNEGYENAPRQIGGAPQPESEGMFGQTPSASNLKLLQPKIVEVDIVDWRLKHDPVSDQDYKEPYVRTARISCFVPMAIFHRMLSGRERITRLKQMADAGISPAGLDENSGDYLSWVCEMTWEVWRLTEPGMSRETFENGLDIDQTLELFEHFFGEPMRRFAERSRFQKARQASRQ